MKKDKKLEGKIGALICDLGKPAQPPASVVNVTINPDPMLLMLTQALKPGKKKMKKHKEEDDCEEEEDYFEEQRDKLLAD